MTEIVPAGSAGRSPERIAELSAALVDVEQKTLNLVRKGLIAANATFTQLTEQEDPSPSQLLNAARAAESLYKLAQSICGEVVEQPNTVNIQVNNMSADAELVAAVAGAYAEIAKGNLERAKMYVGEAEEVIEGELAD